MKKRSGPDLQIKLPKLVDCTGCYGTGIVKGLFHEMPCAPCNGIGFVDDQGAVLETDKALLALTKLVRQQRAVIREQTDLLKEHDIEPDRYGPLKTRHGGLSRGD